MYIPLQAAAAGGKGADAIAMAKLSKQVTSSIKFIVGSISGFNLLQIFLNNKFFNLIILLGVNHVIVPFHNVKTTIITACDG